ncbi:uncharacterized protein LOC144442667 [Glandiceps talaboti]
MSIASVSSFQIFHEPFVVADIYGEERRFPCSLDTVNGYTLADVKCSLEADFPGKIAVFAKDMPTTLRGNMDKLPNKYLHTFLIRDPKSAAISQYLKGLKTLPKINPDVKSLGQLEYMSMKPMWDLYIYVTETLQQKPIVIDSDDLLRSPRKVIQKYCNATGLPFHESMLNWTPGNTSYWFPKFLEKPYVDYFARAIGSSCFEEPQDALRSSSFKEVELPKEVLEIIESNQPMYDELSKNKI